MHNGNHGEKENHIGGRRKLAPLVRESVEMGDLMTMLNRVNIEEVTP
jgi:hypothetical protein